MTPHTRPVRSRSVASRAANTGPAYPASKAAVRDPRWSQVEAALSALRAGGRHAVRIVDVDCGAGTFLLHAVRHARRIGFTAIEARGIDRSRVSIGRARAAANRLADPAIGADFDVADLFTALQSEQDLPADIVIAHGVDALSCDRGSDAVAAALRDAGRIVIDDVSRTVEAAA